MNLAFFVPGLPIPQGSTKAYMRKGARFPTVTADNAKTKPWRNDVKCAALAVRGHVAELPTGPMRVTLAFFMPRPASHFGAKGLKPSASALPAKKPDLDKLVRAVFDALTGVCWRDDSQVVAVEARKEFGTTPGVNVIVAEVRGDVPTRIAWHMIPKRGVMTLQEAEDEYRHRAEEDLYGHTSSVAPCATCGETHPLPGACP